MQQDVWSYYCQPSSVASYHAAAMSVVVIRCQRSRFKEQWMVVVTEEDHLHQRRTTLSNERASRCRHCCASRTTEADGRQSQQRHLS